MCREVPYMDSIAKKLHDSSVSCALVFGSTEFCTELESRGIRVVTVDRESHLPAEDVELDDAVQAVLISVDKSFDFYSASIATRYIHERNVEFFCTDNKPTAEDGSPGAYCLASIVATATSKAPVFTF